jgi:ketosteroid isomerase-like protein
MDFARRIRASMDDFAAGDPASTIELWAPDIRWFAVGSGPLAGRYVGPDAVFGYLGELARLSGGTFRAEAQEVRTLHGDTFVARFRNRAQLPDARLDVVSSLIIEGSGDRVASVVEVQHDEAAWDAFWIRAVGE